MKKEFEVIFGYACQSDLFPQLKSHNTTTLTYLRSLHKTQQAKYIKEKSNQNLNNLALLLHKNAQNNIFAFRISDNLIPFRDLNLYDIQKQHGQTLRKIGQIANNYNMYLSFHPSQFFVLNSLTQKVVANTVQNFNMFALILYLMNLRNTPVLLTHVGGLKGYLDFQKACDAFCANFQRLNVHAKNYLAVQNDQNSHSIDSCLYIHKKIGIPVVLDHAHYKFNPVKGISLADGLKMAMQTWKNRMPKVHLCSEMPGAKVHTHGDYVKLDDYYQVQEGLKNSGVKKVIMMLEVKNKDEALQKLIAQIKANQ